MTQQQTSSSLIKRRQFLQAGSLALGAGVLAAGTSHSQSRRGPTLIVQAELKKLTYGTNWLAQAEHGGFYQAVAAGIYKEHGLDVTIKMGGPQVNGTQLLVGGGIDLFMGSGAAQLFSISEGLPLITVAGIFQKDPQVLLAPPDKGIDSLDDLKGKPIYISSGANTTYWPFLKAKFGFTDDQKRPYNFNSGPFVTDVKNGDITAQQGYLTSEPLAIEKEGGFKPVVLLMADFGYSPYATTIQTTQKLVDSDPDTVQRFVDATIKGWYSFFENPDPAIPLIKKDNTEMTDDLIAYGIEKMQEYGIVMSGDAEKLGIGAMTDERWKALFDSMVEAGNLKADLNYQSGYTLQFINKGADAYKA
ncbi:MAG: ABC transporter substrate-binding protein [Cyanobacteriota bacterium]|nr:ABC transporter substrate-binding protein [Cyanobacteriota bacterium]